MAINKLENSYERPEVQANQKPSGTNYEHVTDTSPGARVWRPGCWQEKQTEERAIQNQSLAAFESNGGEQA
jgi:hypothetical protein